MKKFLAWWEEFWFAPRDLLSLAFMRVLLTGTMLHLYFLRSWNWQYFTDLGMVPRTMALEILPEVARPLWLWTFWPDSAVQGVHALFVFLLLLLFLGLGGRVVAMVAWVLHIGFVYRNYSVLFGADLICGIFLFYMSFTDSCARLSVWNLLRKPQHLRNKSDFVTSALMRMMQVQICVVYAYTGFEKLRGASWWDGTALWSVLANPQMVAFDMSFMRHLPLVIAIGSFSTIVFEIYFPMAMLLPRWRKYWLLAGVALHLSIGVLMGLMHFSLAMLSAYFLFLNPDLVHHWHKRLTDSLGGRKGMGS